MNHNVVIMFIIIRRRIRQLEMELEEALKENRNHYYHQY